MSFFSDIVSDLGLSSAKDVLRNSHFANVTTEKLFELPETTSQEYQEMTDKQVDLRYSLSSKFLPIVYGVRKLPAIPIFLDTLVDQPDTLYAIYAVCDVVI